MKKGKLFLATAFIPVMTGAALYLVVIRLLLLLLAGMILCRGDLMWNAERATRMDQLH